MSRLLSRTGTLFHHIPRTGGTWIDEALKLCDIPQHSWRKPTRHKLPRKHALFGQMPHTRSALVKNAFGFVRHPFAYYESVWKYLRMAGKNRASMANNFHWHPFQVAARVYVPDFNEWVQRMLDSQPLFVTRLFEAYVGPPGGEFVQWIGRTESLRDDFIRIMHEAGYGDEVEEARDGLEELGSQNASASDLIRWNDTQKRRVWETEREAINRFYFGERKRRIHYAELAQKETEGVASR